jgi:hypothetical protein
MADYEERLGKDLPLDRIEQWKERTTREIQDFTVSFALEDELLGSGTLVDAYGVLGILTAFHVADFVERNPDRILALIIAQHAHRFELPRDCIEHVPLGIPSEDRPADGPDLSFIKLYGKPEISTIKAKKSFYRISGKSFEDLQGLPLDKTFWWIAGAPEEKSSSMTSKAPEGALRAIHLVAEASYKNLTGTDQFDILTLNVNADKSPFPSNYGGCSGGGVWVSPLTMDPDKGISTLDISPCLLAGVAYFQGDWIQGSRDIFANGPTSLKRMDLLREQPAQ